MPWNAVPEDAFGDAISAGLPQPRFAAGNGTTLLRAVLLRWL